MVTKGCSGVVEDKIEGMLRFPELTYRTALKSFCFQPSLQCGKGQRLGLYAGAAGVPGIISSFFRACDAHVEQAQAFALHNPGGALGWPEPGSYQAIFIIRCDVSATATESRLPGSGCRERTTFQRLAVV